MNMVLIDGRWLETDEHDDVFNPASGEPVGAVARSTSQLAGQAVDAAASAFDGWAATTPKERGEVLHAVADLLEERAESIAELLCRESGKLLGEARGEIGLSAAFIRWFAEEGRRARGELIPSPFPNKRAAVIARPVGPVAVLTPWNFPVSIPARKLAPALAAGCTTVFRPSGEAPLSAVELVRCFNDAGLPSGALNLVTGPVGTTSDVVLADARIRHVTFTGSTRVGQRICRAAAETLAKPSLELGGDAPFIVFEDADLGDAIELAMTAKYRNNGQSCIAMNRLLLHEGIADEFLDGFVKRTESLRLGDPLLDETSLGPVISEQAQDRLTTWVSQAVDNGGRLLAGGTSRPDRNGWFVTPSVVMDPPPSSRMACDEIFGPAVGVWTFSNLEEALSRANDTSLGLSAYVCTQSLATATRMAEDLQAGVVGINDPTPTTPEAPFGGVGKSGYGKEGGHQGLAEFLEHKYVSKRLPG